MYKFSYLRTICDDILDKLLDGNKPEYGIRLNNNIYIQQNQSPSIGITNWTRPNKFVLHFGKHFQELTLDNKIFVLKHECCHIADIHINGIESVLKQDKTGHGKSFQELCKKANCKFSLSVDYSETYFVNYKQRQSQSFFIRKQVESSVKPCLEC